MTAPTVLSAVQGAPELPEVQDLASLTARLSPRIVTFDGVDGNPIMLELPADVHIAQDASGEFMSSSLALPPPLARKFAPRALDVIGLAREGLVDDDGRVGLIVRGPVHDLVRELPYARPFAAVGMVAVHVRVLDLGTLAALPAVERIHVDERYQPTLTDSVPLVRATEAHARHDEQGGALVGTGVTIAIIDTGVDAQHPDLGGCFGPGCKVVGGYDFVGDDAYPEDVVGHGTHVAATAAGIRGVAPGASILAYRVCDTDGCWGHDIIAAIENATLAGARVASISLGGPGTTDGPLATAVDWAVGEGMVVVSSAGNSGPDEQTVGEPAAAISGIAVGAATKEDALARFSSRGPVYDSTGAFRGVKPDLVAPGVDIVAAVPNGSCMLCAPSGQRPLSGTSMSAPHVSGAVALLLQAHPSWQPDDVKVALMGGAVPLDLPLRVAGAGRLDVVNALDAQVGVLVEGHWGGQVDADAAPVVLHVAAHVRNLGDTPRNISLRADGGPLSMDPVPHILVGPREVVPVTLTFRADHASAIDSWADVRLLADEAGATVGEGALTILRFTGLDLTFSDQTFLALIFSQDGGGTRVLWYPTLRERHLAPPGVYRVLALSSLCTDSSCQSTEEVYTNSGNVTVAGVASVDMQPGANLHNLRHETPRADGRPLVDDAVYSCGYELEATPCWSTMRLYIALDGHGGVLTYGWDRVPDIRSNSLEKDYVIGFLQGYRDGAVSYMHGNGTRGVDGDVTWRPQFHPIGYRHNVLPMHERGFRSVDCPHWAGFFNQDYRYFEDDEREQYYVDFNVEEMWGGTGGWYRDTVAPCADFIWQISSGGPWYADDCDDCVELGLSLVNRVTSDSVELWRSACCSDAWYDERYSRGGNGDILHFDGAPYLQGGLSGAYWGNVDQVYVGGVGHGWTYSPFGPSSGGIQHAWQGDRLMEPRVRLEVGLNGELILDERYQTHQTRLVELAGQGNVTARLSFDKSFINDAWSNVSYSIAYHTDDARANRGGPVIDWTRVVGDDGLATRFGAQEPRALWLKTYIGWPWHSELPDRVRVTLTRGAASACFEHPAPEAGAACGGFVPPPEPPAPPASEDLLPAEVTNLLRQLGVLEEPTPDHTQRHYHTALGTVLPDLGLGAYDVRVEAWSASGATAMLTQSPAFIVG